MVHLSVKRVSILLLINYTFASDSKIESIIIVIENKK